MLVIIKMLNEVEYKKKIHLQYKIITKPIYLEICQIIHQIFTSLSNIREKREYFKNFFGLGICFSLSQRIV